MNFAIPRQDNTELLLYVWKIIDLPYIHLDDLLYKISYELFLFPPERATTFIKTLLKENLLIEDENGMISLSTTLNKRLLLWQADRKNTVLGNIKSVKKRRLLTTKIENDEKSSFSLILKSFSDKNTLNRAVNISDKDFDVQELDNEKGMIKSSVAGSKENSYYIEIDLKKKLLKHNCHDFETRRSKNKQFCKHLVRLFLLLKEKNEQSAEFFLKELAKDVEEWEFSP
ncbi:MAG: hypothetical protein KGD58_09950 [Candidatus Lokiarchaeota archaeon]|nr:hypothetical protein [Candidatus Lokiarchaeota archaeon]